MSGGIGSAAQNVRYAKESVHAGLACPYDRVDLIVVLELFQLKRVVRVDQDDDLGAVLFCQLEHVFLVLGQCQRALEGIAFCAVEHGRLVVCRFRAVARDHADRCCSVGRCQHIICIHGGRDLTHKVDSRLFPGRLEGRYQTCAGEECLTCVSKSLVTCQKADHLLVDLKSSCEHRVDEIDVFLALTCRRSGTDHTAARSEYAVVSPERYGLSRSVQGKRAVVLEKNSAFRADLLGQLCFGRQ